MKDLIINQIIVPVLIVLIGTIIEIGRRQLKKFLGSNEELIDKQKQALQQSIGIELYNKDRETIRDAVKAVEQLGKENHWAGSLKHSKVFEMVQGKTGLTDEEIFNIIKATVAEFNIIKTTASV
jgi:hypothetical protein